MQYIIKSIFSINEEKYNIKNFFKYLLNNKKYYLQFKFIKSLKEIFINLFDIY